jgi:hypothetical protein
MSKKALEGMWAILTSIDTDCGVVTWQRVIVEWLLFRDVGVVRFCDIADFVL